MTSYIDYNYSIKLNGSYLGKDKNLSIEEACITDVDVIICEGKSKQTSWIFTNDDIPIEGSCNNCPQLILPVKCDCKKFAYCDE